MSLRRGLPHTLICSIYNPQHGPKFNAESLFTILLNRHIWESGDTRKTERIPQAARFHMFESKRRITSINNRAVMGANGHRTRNVQKRLTLPNRYYRHHVIVARFTFGEQRGQWR